MSAYTYYQALLFKWINFHLHLVCLPYLEIIEIFVTMPLALVCMYIVQFYQEPYVYYVWGREQLIYNYAQLCVMLLAWYCEKLKVAAAAKHRISY